MPWQCGRHSRALRGGCFCGPPAESWVLGVWPARQGHSTSHGWGGGGETWLEVVLNNEWVVLHGSRRECLRPPATGELVWGLFKGAEGGVNW